MINTALEDFQFYKSKMNQKKWDLTGFRSLLETAHPLLRKTLVENNVIEVTMPGASSSMEI
jgi:hypothetical protein